MKTTGIILELNKGKAVVMTDEVGFTVIKRKPGMFVGQQVDLGQPGSIEFNPARYRYIYGLTSVAVFIIIVLFTVNYQRQADLYAYVTVDINPSIEFTVNKETQVINVRNLNNDGMILLRGINLKKMPIGKALLTLVNKAEQDHYFKKGRFILISATANEVLLKEPELLVESIKKLKEELTQRDINLQFIKTTLAQRKMAIQNHLSMGRYALLTSAGNTAKSIDLDEAKKASIFSLLDKAGMLDKELRNGEDLKTGKQAKKEDNDLHPDVKTLPDPNSLKAQKSVKPKNIKQDDASKDYSAADDFSDKKNVDNSNDNQLNNVNSQSDNVKNDLPPGSNSMEENNDKNDKDNDNENDKNNNNDNKENNTGTGGVNSEKENVPNSASSMGNAGSNSNGSSLTNNHQESKGKK